MEEEIIKENIIQLNRWVRLPFPDITYGHIKLTKEKLIIDYYLFSIVVINKVCGVGKRKIEIPIQNIKDISDAQHCWSGVLKITYLENLKTKKIYVRPWRYFELIRSMQLISRCREWIEEVNKLRNLKGKV